MIGPDRAEDRRAVAWLLGFISRQQGPLLRILLVALGSMALVLVQPLLTRMLIDRGIIAGDGGTLIEAGLLMLGAAVAAAFLGWFNRYQHVSVSADILFALRRDLFQHLLRLSPGFFQRWRSGDLLARMDGDVAEIQRFAVDGLLAAISTALGLVGALALMLMLSWQLSLIAFFLLPIEYLLLRRLRPRVEATTRALRERNSDLSAFLVERLPAAKMIQASGAEAREAAALGELQGAFKGDLMRQQMLGYVTGAVPGLLTSASNVLVFMIGGWMVISGALTLGTLIAFSAYLGRAAGPVQTLLGLYVGAQRALVSLRRVHELRSVAPAIETPADPVPLREGACGKIHFEEVHFAHEAAPLLNGLDLVIEPGEKVGLIGLSGAGKSTLIDLLQRHHDPTSGRVTLDGVDLRRLDLRQLRQKVVVVAQETVLFRGTLLDNIRYAAPGVDQAAVRHAAARARLDHVADTLPERYETDLGSGGGRLSGGERQRVAIARALLQDPLVLILDEATSAIDTATEAEIIETVDRLFAGRTRLLISHRPETLRGVDRLVELVDGKLYERPRAG
ncbi:MAG: ABC transporter ATP-binding protein [Alphaproteobacteria bacterium]